MLRARSAEGLTNAEIARPDLSGRGDREDPPLPDPAEARPEDPRAGGRVRVPQRAGPRLDSSPADVEKCPVAPTRAGVPDDRGRRHEVHAHDVRRRGRHDGGAQPRVDRRDDGVHGRVQRRGWSRPASWSRARPGAARHGQDGQPGRRPGGGHRRAVRRGQGVAGRLLGARRQGRGTGRRAGVPGGRLGRAGRAARGAGRAVGSRDRATVFGSWRRRCSGCWPGGTGSSTRPRTRCRRRCCRPRCSGRPRACRTTRGPG